MIGKLEPYFDYAESGHLWIGSVPRHWHVLPNRAVFQQVNERDHPEQEMLSVTITQGVIPQKLLLSDTSKRDGSNQDRSAYKLVSPGDLVYNKMRAWQGAVGISSHEGIVSPAYVVMRFRAPQNSRYFHYLYRTPQFAKEAERWSYGITSDMWSLRPEHFKIIYSPVPLPGEQAAIVRFLDWATVRLDRAIRIKRKLIALLSEQKQAIIQRAVTHGLDANVPLKPSGISWLGHIPQHWGSRSFSRLARIVRGASPRPAGDPKLFDGSHIPWLTVGEVTKDPGVYLTHTGTCLTERGAEQSARFSAGTLIITNSGATLGVPKILSIDVCANDGIVAFRRLSSEVNPVFAFYYLSTLTNRLRDELRQGGTQPNLNTAIIGRIGCPLPPADEQQAIIRFIEAELSELHLAMGRMAKEIELLLEYRTRLIADVVTGKLDVRGVDVPQEQTPEVSKVTREDSIESEAEEDELVEEYTDAD